MKFFRSAIFCLSTFFATIAFGERTSFMPDNDLWQQDSMESMQGLDEATFNKIIDAAMDAYKPIASANKETLVITKKWTDSTVNANCSRGFGSVTVNMYGGLARRPEVNPEGFALVVCHELGHAYAGLPYVQASRKMSAEGQSDYYATLTCLEKVYKALDLPTENGKYALEKCEAKFGENNEKYNVCLMGMSGGLSLGKLLSVLSNETVPAYETPDTNVVTKTEVSYPATTQCRTDTYGAGALKLDRPKCWFKN